MSKISSRSAALKATSHHVSEIKIESAKAIQIRLDGADIIFVIDNNAQSRETLRETLQSHAFQVQVFNDSQSFLRAHKPGRRGCLLVDLSMAQDDGIKFIKNLKANNFNLSVIAMATRFIPTLLVQAMKAGASDCLEKPISQLTLVNAIECAMEESDAAFDANAFHSLAIQRIAMLTTRQREILDLVAKGHPTKIIADDLNISQRTVENHRAAIAKKTYSKSLSDVVHTAICAKCSLIKSRH